MITFFGFQMGEGEKKYTRNFFLGDVFFPVFEKKK